MPTVIGCLDRAMRAFGGRADVLVDRQRAHGHHRSRRRGSRSATRRWSQSAAHYGVTIATCVPADPESKGGSEATVRIAKADLVPTDANLLDDYASLGRAGRRVRDVHRRGQRPGPSGHPAGTGRDARRGTAPPAPPCPSGPTRRCSVRPARCRGRRRSATAGSPTRSRTPWPMRRCGSASTATRSSVTHCGRRGGRGRPTSPRRHPGTPVIDDAHYPPRPDGPLARQPKATQRGRGRVPGHRRRRPAAGWSKPPPAGTAG